jgi:hypothetical protein
MIEISAVRLTGVTAMPWSSFLVWKHLCWMSLERHRDVSQVHTPPNPRVILESTGSLSPSSSHLGVFHRDVHVPIKRAHDPAVIHAAVQLHQNLLAFDGLQEVGRGLGVGHGDGWGREARVAKCSGRWVAGACC